MIIKLDIKRTYLYLTIRTMCIFLVLASGCGDGIHSANQNLERPSPLLQNIELSAGTLSPRFDPFKTEYWAEVSEDISTIAFKLAVHKGIREAIKKNNAAIDINGLAYTPGALSAPLSLDVWEPSNNVFIITVTSFGKVKKYSLAISLAPVANETFQDYAAMVDDGSGDPRDVTFDAKYRDDLANHPGCIKRPSYNANTGYFTAGIAINEAVVPDGSEAAIPGYPCAAKEYTVVEDISKPIVVLVHANCDSINAWEEYYSSTLGGLQVITKSKYMVVIDANLREMLASKLVKNGFKTIAVDFRTDLVSTLSGYNQANYAGKNYLNPNNTIDHGWAVPILQQLLKSLMRNHPNRKISIVAHSLGATVTRDALRRLFVEHIRSAPDAVNPWPHLKDLIFLHGPNHGASINMEYCEIYRSMYVQMFCQLGSMEDSVRTEFIKRLNGSNDKWSTPCGDGVTAFGLEGYCQGNTIDYATVAIDDDLSSLKIRDELLSEATIRLHSPYCENYILDPNSYDSSGYFVSGQYANHFAGPRSAQGMELILQKLLD